VTNTDVSVMDGLVACAEIRKLERVSGEGHQLIIGLTGNARQRQLAEAMEAGMDDGELLWLSAVYMVGRVSVCRVVLMRRVSRGETVQIGGPCCED
jgi:CheY-like chemotaxis protein